LRAARFCRKRWPGCRCTPYSAAPSAARWQIRIVPIKPPAEMAAEARKLVDKGYRGVS
jgi:hypothetical protein